MDSVLAHYPDIHWHGVKGVRDVLAHQYFIIDAEEVFYICMDDLQPLRDAVRGMIGELKNSNTS
ncbi:MAG: HepT-like ribonuclease domain-containing protein [Candidatus Methanogasteraceae archaeon]